MKYTLCLRDSQIDTRRSNLAGFERGCISISVDGSKVEISVSKPMHRINKKACAGMVQCCPNRTHLAHHRCAKVRVMGWELRRSERVRTACFSKRLSRLGRFPCSLLVLRRNVGRGWQRVMHRHCRPPIFSERANADTVKGLNRRHKAPKTVAWRR